MNSTPRSVELNQFCTELISALQARYDKILPRCVAILSFGKRGDKVHGYTSPTFTWGFQGLSKAQRCLSIIFRALARVTGFNVFFHCGFHGSPIVGCRKSSKGSLDAKVSSGWVIMVVMKERNTKVSFRNANFVVSVEYSIMYVVGALWFFVLF
jgi:hypothetical protein